MRKPVNLYYTPQGHTALRYSRVDGSIVERLVKRPTALLVDVADPMAEVQACELPSAQALLFNAYRAMPLIPEAAWSMAKDANVSTLFHETFQHFLTFLRQPPEKRWCVRGEPHSFLQFGYQGSDGCYIMGAFVLPCGKPSVLTFRSEDLIQALPPSSPFSTMTVVSASDGATEQTDLNMGWDTRIRLPIQDNGAALIKLYPNPTQEILS
jgi:hypothetical protein